jgi:hypothetical protein
LFWLFPLIFDLPQTVDFTTFIIFIFANVLFAGKRLLESECHLARRRILPCFGMGVQAFQHLCLRETAGWGWEDSNFQPNDYQPSIDDMRNIIRAIAAEAHAGQVDKAGAPYVLHDVARERFVSCKCGAGRRRHDLCRLYS